MLPTLVVIQSSRDVYGVGPHLQFHWLGSSPLPHWFGGQRLQGVQSYRVGLVGQEWPRQTQFLMLPEPWSVSPPEFHPRSNRLKQPISSYFHLSLEMLRGMRVFIQGVLGLQGLFGLSSPRETTSTWVTGGERSSSSGSRPTTSYPWRHLPTGGRPIPPGRR